MRKAIRRGDLFYADLNPVVGSEQGGIRPVLVIQNDVGNHFSPTVVAAAITSRKAKNSLPTHILLKDGKIEYLKIGRAYRIPKAHILRYLKITCSTFAE